VHRLPLAGEVVSKEARWSEISAGFVVLGVTPEPPAQCRVSGSTTGQEGPASGRRRTSSKV